MREYVKTEKGFHIYFEAIKEEIPAEEAFSKNETGYDYRKLIKRINDGEEDYFCAKVSAVNPETGEEVDAEYLGCCVYTPARTFIKESGYFDDMVKTLIEKLDTGKNQLEFRAFDNALQEMRYSSLHNEFFVRQNGLVHVSSVEPHSENYEIMEFTGKTDRFEQKVFENDIVEQHIKSEYLDEEDWRIIVGKVVKVKGQWCITSDQYPLFGFDVVILGNVYDEEFQHFKAP